MRFTPKSEEEIAEEGLLPDGVYPVTVDTAEDRVSRSGNDMIELRLKVYQGDKSRYVMCYLLPDAMPHLLRHAADVFGLIERYQAGELEAFDFVGKQGYAKIGKQPAKGDYGPRNSVRDFVRQDERGVAPDVKLHGPPPSARAAASDPFDDDIPF